MSCLKLTEETQERDVRELRRMARVCMLLADTLRECGRSYHTILGSDVSPVVGILKHGEFQLEELFRLLEMVSCMIGDLETAKGGEQS